MTCIVWIKNKDTVLIWWDSAGVFWNNLTIRKDNKVFQVWNFIFGCTSSFRMIDILKYSFIPPELWQKSIEEYMATDFVDEIRKVFKEKWYTEINNNRENWWKFLVWTIFNWEPRLFTIDWDFQIWESLFNCSAIWCWEEYALGCLYNEKGDDIKKSCENALKTAEYFSTWVVWPFNYVELWT